MGAEMSAKVGGKDAYSQILKKQISGALFSKYDADSDAILSAGELKKMLREEFGLSDEQIRVAGSLLDGDQSGTIDVKEFNAILKEKNLCRLICNTESCKFLSESWKIFRKHDKDRSGNLTKMELKGLLCSLDIPPASADEILASADANKNALLNFHEFVHWLPATALMLQQYKQ